MKSVVAKQVEKALSRIDYGKYAERVIKRLNRFEKASAKRKLIGGGSLCPCCRKIPG